MLTYDQLEQFSMAKLRGMAMQLRDTIGANAVPKISSAGGVDSLIRWVLDVQISCCMSIGLRASLQDFGAPKDFGSADDQGYFAGDKGQSAYCSRNLSNVARHPMSAIQPAHRNLGADEAIEKNQEEAHSGFLENQRRNRGTVQFG